MDFSILPVIIFGYFSSAVFNLGLFNFNFGLTKLFFDVRKFKLKIEYFIYYFLFNIILDNN